MDSMNERRPSVNHPSTGLALLPHDQLPRLGARYRELLRILELSPAAIYVRAVLQQIDDLEAQSA